MTNEDRADLMADEYCGARGDDLHGYQHDRWNIYRNGVLAGLQGATPSAVSGSADREALEKLFDQAFTDGIAAGRSGDESILAGSSAAYAQSAINALTGGQES